MLKLCFGQAQFRPIREQAHLIWILLLFFESILAAYREAFIYDGWPIDTFIYALDTLRYFCRKLKAGDGRPALINMILQEREILVPNELSSQAKDIASEALAKGQMAGAKSKSIKSVFSSQIFWMILSSPKKRGANNLCSTFV